MLIYHPISDVNHCAYRLLRLLEASAQREFSWDQIRLFDFYSLFPQALKSIKPFPKELLAYKKLVERIPDAYESMPNEHRIMFQLMPIQNTAIHNLLARDFIDTELHQDGRVSRSKRRLPRALANSIKDDPILNEGWFRFLVDELPAVDFDGRKGLKFRSNLLEYRYDG